MFSFLLCLVILILGYFLYGKVVENTFGPDDRETPAVRINDGVDYVVLPQWKLFMIQLLNIAGLGPIFGALSGALWGPMVFLWITFGTIFAGGVHDYFSGMLSARNDGVSISEISGIYLGGAMKNVMRVFSVVLLVMVGTVCAVGPAGLLQLLQFLPLVVLPGIVRQIFFLHLRPTGDRHNQKRHPRVFPKSGNSLTIFLKNAGLVIQQYLVQMAVLAKVHAAFGRARTVIAAAVLFPHGEVHFRVQRNEKAAQREMIAHIVFDIVHGAAADQ